MIIATIWLCVLGHIVRDGWPATGSTHAARGLGGLCCIMGGYLEALTWMEALLGAASFIAPIGRCSASRTGHMA